MKKEEELREEGGESDNDSEGNKDEEEGGDEDEEEKKEVQKKDKGRNLRSVWTWARKKVVREQFHTEGVSNDYIVDTIGGSHGWAVTVDQQGATTQADAILWNIGEVSPTSSPDTIADWGKNTWVQVMWSLSGTIDLVQLGEIEWKRAWQLVPRLRARCVHRKDCPAGRACRRQSLRRWWWSG